MDRDELIAHLADLPAQREAAAPKTAADFRQFNVTVSENLEKAGMTYPEALAYAERHRAIMAAASVGGDILSNYRAGTAMMRQSARDQLVKLRPPALVAAIREMEAEIEKRKTIGVEMVTFSPVPGSPLYPSRRKRTPADDAALVRAEQALGRLLALTFTPGDLTKEIKAILDDLHAKDSTALLATPEPAKPATVATAAGVRVCEIAEIED